MVARSPLVLPAALPRSSCVARARVSAPVSAIVRVAVNVPELATGPELAIGPVSRIGPAWVTGR